MSKVELNYDNLRYGCVQNLNDSISNINKALTYFNQMVIPRDFQQAGVLKGVQKELSRSNNNIASVRDWVSSSNQDFDDLIGELVQQSNSLPVNSIRQRVNKI